MMRFAKALKIIKGSAGVTMTELIVVAGIMGVVMLGLASQFSTRATGTTAVGRELAFINIVGQIQRVANSNILCSQNFTGIIPTTGMPATITTPSATYSTGSTIQTSDGPVLITKLQWAQVAILSPFEYIGYLYAQVDLTGGVAGTVFPGGNIRDFPAGGVNPPGIAVHMNINPMGGALSSCGPLIQNSSLTKYVSVPIVTNNINDKRIITGHAVLPGAPFPDTNYTITCGIVDGNFGAGGKYCGQVSVVNKFTNGFDWKFWQQIDDYVAPGSTFYTDCVAHHY